MAASQTAKTEPIPAGNTPDFRLLFESAPGLYLVLTPEFRIVAVSDAYLQATMTERVSILDKHIFEVFPDNPDDPGADGVRKLRESLMRARASGKPDAMAVQKYDVRRPASDGGGFEERYWSPVNTPVLSQNGELRYIIHRVQDVTEFIRLKHTGEEQEKVAEALRTRTAQAEWEIYQRAQQLAGANTQLRDANRELANLYSQIAQLMAQADEELRLRTGTPETAPQPDSGGITSREMLDRVGGLIAAHRRLEEQLRQAHRLEAVGRLAGGIAHDFNNLLTVILGYCNMLLASLPPGDKIHQRLAQIHEAGERAAGLTRQLLAFSRQQVLQPRIVNLAATLEAMDRMLAAMLGDSVTMTTVVDPDLAQVRVDPGQMEQVIMNLALNARDPMPGGGRLTLELRNTELDPGGSAFDNVPPGRYVTLTVGDSGIGMDREIQRLAFEPFFTTKEPGKGTGLGLATVYGIVRQSGGHVWLGSEPGLGTTFQIFLPRVDEPPEPLTPRESPRIARGHETVLLVEDDTRIRSMLTEILAAAGYSVIAPATGREAIRIAAEDPRAIHLLLTDVILPEIGGLEIAKELGFLRPALKTLLMSGYTGDALLQQGVLDEPVSNFIAKPFTPAALCAKVRSVLDASTALRRVLVVDDAPAILDLLTAILEPAGYEVHTASNGREAREAVHRHRVDLVITDLVMPEEEGIETIVRLRRDHPAIKVIAMSGGFGGVVLDAARMMGASATLSKPLTAEAVLGCIESVSSAGG